MRQWLPNLNKIKIKYTELKKYLSEHLPPKITHIISNKSCLEFNEFSLGKYCAKPNEPFDLGIMVN
jgi:hypothetical protein